MPNPLINRFLNYFLLQKPISSFINPKQYNIEAAVLVPIITHPSPTILLTKRAATLRQHANEISFPGGMVEAGDTSLIHTALREAEEEIAISSPEITIIGQLPPVKSRSGLIVTPIIGLLPPDLSLCPNSNEVVELIEIPFQHALLASNYQVLVVKQHQLHPNIFVLPHSSYLIWGLTAHILYCLAQQIAPMTQDINIIPSA